VAERPRNAPLLVAVVATLVMLGVTSVDLYPRVFGLQRSASGSIPDHEARACEVALRIQEALVELDQRSKREDHAAAIMAERCAELERRPPAADWDGMYDQHGK